MFQSSSLAHHHLLHVSNSPAGNCSNQQRFLNSLNNINHRLININFVQRVNFGHSIIGLILGDPILRMIAGFDNKHHGFVDHNFISFDHKLGCSVSTGRGSHPHLGRRCQTSVGTLNEVRPAQSSSCGVVNHRHQHRGLLVSFEPSIQKGQQLYLLLFFGCSLLRRILDKHPGSCLDIAWSLGLDVQLGGKFLRNQRWHQVDGRSHHIRYFLNRYEEFGDFDGNSCQLLLDWRMRINLCLTQIVGFAANWGLAVNIGSHLEEDVVE
jgi:hypothetical protein